MGWAVGIVDVARRGGIRLDSTRPQAVAPAHHHWNGSIKKMGSHDDRTAKDKKCVDEKASPNCVKERKDTAQNVQPSTILEFLEHHLWLRRGWSWSLDSWLLRFIWLQARFFDGLQCLCSLQCFHLLHTL